MATLFFMHDPVDLVVATENVEGKIIEFVKEGNISVDRVGIKQQGGKTAQIIHLVVDPILNLLLPFFQTFSPYRITAHDLTGTVNKTDFGQHVREK